MGLFDMAAGAVGEWLAPVKQKAVDLYDQMTSDSALGAEVDDVMDKSPTLTENVARLREAGWTIRYGEPGSPSNCDETNHVIYIAPDERKDPNKVARSLAHETGHALYEEPEVSMEGKSRDEYVEERVQQRLRDEAEAHIMNLRVRDEVLGMDGRGPDIGVSGNLSAAYKALWAHYSDADQHETLRDEIAQVFRDEEPSGGIAVTYGDLYADGAEKAWDRKHAEE